MGDRWKERHLRGWILPNNVLKRRPPVSEFNNSTGGVRRQSARQGWTSEIAINDNDGRTIPCK